MPKKQKFKECVLDTKNFLICKVVDSDVTVSLRKFGNTKFSQIVFLLEVVHSV